MVGGLSSNPRSPSIQYRLLSFLETSISRVAEGTKRGDIIAGLHQAIAKDIGYDKR